jgi:hypothetical protein
MGDSPRNSAFSVTGRQSTRITPTVQGRRPFFRGQPPDEVAECKTGIVSSKASWPIELEDSASHGALPCQGAIGE